MRFAVMGLGPVGGRITACAVAAGHEFVGAIDRDPAKVGQDAGVVLGGVAAGVQVVEAVGDLEGDVEIVFQATSSSLMTVAADVHACIDQHLDFVSTCEELSYPWRTQPEVAQDLDAAARKNNVRVLGTGINPGFAMDMLVLAATIPCWTVHSVQVSRVVDVAKRRLPLQRKVGLGLSEDEFRVGVDNGTIGHVGLRESAWLVADRLRLRGGRFLETIDPVTVGREVRGLHQVGRLFRDGEEVVHLELDMYAGATNHDEIVLDANPPLRIAVPGGLPGEEGTAGVVVNAASEIRDAPAGLLTMADLPLPHVRGNSAGAQRDR